MQAVLALRPLVLGTDLTKVFHNEWLSFYRKLTNDGQLRWIGPEKGAIHLASAAILNAVWDFWAKLEQKPLWKLLIDLEPEHLIECLDFSYLSVIIDGSISAHFELFLILFAGLMFSPNKKL